MSDIEAAAVAMQTSSLCYGQQDNCVAVPAHRSRTDAATGPVDTSYMYYYMAPHLGSFKDIETTWGQGQLLEIIPMCKTLYEEQK